MLTQSHAMRDPDWDCAETHTVSQRCSRYRDECCLSMTSDVAPTESQRRSQRALLPGTVLEDRYEILRVAGRGGMSTVYAARDRRFGQVERLCAVKEMFDVDPDTRVRALRLVNFERESALLAMLSHPAIPRIYDYFIYGGLVYLVLEFIDGQDLERYLTSRGAPCSEDQIVRWGLEIADVLQTLHDQKPDPIIFRDLKPSNIMLRTSGQLVLIDFGIARTIQGRQRGTMIGTEGYAPPEQYRGIVDARGDIYALGATLHHLATNSDPRIETPFTFHERPIQKLNPEISDALSAVIMKTLAYNPVDRYQSVDNLREDLLQVQRMSTVEAYRMGEAAQARAAGPASTHVNPAVLEVDELKSEEAVLKRSRDVRQAAPKKRAARRRRDVLPDIGDRLAWATATGDEVRGSAVFDGHSFEIGSYDGHLYSIAALDGAVRWKFRTGRGVVTRPAVYHDNVIFGSEDHSVYSVNRITCAMGWSFRTGMAVRSSPVVVGDHVVLGSDDGWIYCLRAGTGELVWRHRTWGPVRSSPAAADLSVVVGSDDTNLYNLAVDSGDVLWRASCGGSIQSAPTVSGDRVLATSRGGFVSSMSLATGDRVWYHEVQSPVLASPRVTGDTVVFGAVDGMAIGLALDDGALRWSAQVANQITATALLAGDRGYVGTIDGDCVCFNVTTGDVVWRHSVGAGIVSTAAYGNGVLVVGSIDGHVYGLTLTDDEITAFEEGAR
ncbi:MAG TPA: serine/threonine-protein kinase [Thermomicrobiales bacterium]|nr:serine/threonine-protein kinase [Thermomicrobiales bacterium]